MALSKLLAYVLNLMALNYYRFMTTSLVFVQAHNLIANFGIVANIYHS